jgi:hypothetical protein
MGKETLPPPPPAPRESAEREPAEKTPLDRALEYASTRESLYALGEENLRKAFVPNYTTAGDGSASGKLAFRGNKNHEKWIGLKHIIPSEYTSVTVTTPAGEVIEGTRGQNGSFYDAEGRYVAVWEGHSFKALAKPVESRPPQPEPSAQTPPSLDRTSENPSALAEIPISETVFVGDSLSVGMLHPDVRALSGSHGYNQIKRDKRGNIVEIGAASGGKQTGFMLGRMRGEIENWQRAGVKRVVIFGGVNDIGSRKTSEQVQKNLQAMYRLAHEHGMTVIACTIPDWNPLRSAKNNAELAALMTQRTSKLNRWIVAQRGSGIDGPDSVVDLYAETADRGQFPRSPDQLHFAWKGSRNMANLITSQANIKTA